MIINRRAVWLTGCLLCSAAATFLLGGQNTALQTKGPLALSLADATAELTGAAWHAELDEQERALATLHDDMERHGLQALADESTRVLRDSRGETDDGPRSPNRDGVLGTLLVSPHRLSVAEVLRSRALNENGVTTVDPDAESTLLAIRDVFAPVIEDLRSRSGRLAMQDLRHLHTRGVLDQYDPLSDPGEVGEILRERLEELENAGASSEEAREQTLRDFRDGRTRIACHVYLADGKRYCVPRLLLLNAGPAVEARKYAEDTFILTVVGWSVVHGLMSVAGISGVTDWLGARP